MGVLDKFLNVMRLNPDDDDDFYNDDYDYDDDYEEEEPVKKSSSRKEKKEAYEEERPIKSTPKVTPIRPVKKPSNAGMEVCVIKPTSVEDAREITETLLAGRTVILNLEGMDLEIAQRIIDFISGATFAISGNLQKISNYIFLVTPTNVDISGDLQDLLSGSMDQPTVRGRY